MISLPKSFTIKINIAFILESELARLPRSRLERGEIIGRLDENSPYEHTRPVAKMKCSDFDWVPIHF